MKNNKDYNMFYKIQIEKIQQFLQIPEKLLNFLKSLVANKFLNNIDMINDCSGGKFDDKMLDFVS